MSIQGSQIPAESRVDQIMSRIDTLVGSGTPSYAQASDGKPAGPSGQDFKMMAAMMQAQMMGEAFANPSDNDSNNNPMAGMMGMMGGMGNPMMAGMPGTMQGMMPGMMGGMQNPAMLGLMMNGMGGQYQQLMQQSQQQMPSNEGFNENELHNHFHDSDEHSHYGSEAKVMPVKGRISSDYGSRVHPVTGHSHFHSGVDIAAPKGASIKMPWDGKVVFVGNVSGFGPNTVIVAHENKIQADGKIVYSIFGHNSAVMARKGDQLNAGEVVATVGSEGRSTGPHVHWETRVAAPGIEGKNIFKNQIAYTVDPMTVA